MTSIQSYVLKYIVPNIPDVGELMAACFASAESRVANWYVGQAIRLD